MTVITGQTRGGTEWTPAFVTALDESLCIGCGRCYQVCPREVFDLVERDFEMDDEDDCEWDDEFDPEAGAMVMRLVNALDCIGCEACSRVCPKGCHSHEAGSV